MKTVTRSRVTRENFTIRMEPTLKKALKIRAVEEERDPSDLIEDAVTFYLSSTSTLTPIVTSTAVRSA